MKFRILAGSHIDTGPDGKDHLYRTGDIVDTNADLCRLNGDGMSPKFERLDDSGQSVSGSPTSTMSHGPITVEEAARRGFDPSVSNTGPTSPPLQTSTTSSTRPSHKSGKLPPQTEREYMELLNSMSVKELQAHAAEEEIDVKGLTTKDALIKEIRTAS